MNKCDWCIEMHPTELSHGGELSAILRASGSDFDVDKFIIDCDWDITAVFHRGEPYLKTKAEGRRRERSGFNAFVSEAGFHDFREQVKDAIEFLKECGDEVRRLVSFPGVDWVSIDFGIAWHDVAAQSDHFPAGLVRLAGACGIALELSHYPVSDGETVED